MRDKAIAERERVKAEIETSAMRRQLAENEGAEVAARIDKVGAALSATPTTCNTTCRTSYRTSIGGRARPAT